MKAQSDAVCFGVKETDKIIFQKIIMENVVDQGKGFLVKDRHNWWGARMNSQEQFTTPIIFSGLLLLTKCVFHRKLVRFVKNHPHYLQSTYW